MKILNWFRRKEVQPAAAPAEPEKEKKGVFTFSTHKNFSAISPDQLSRLAFPVQTVNRVNTGTGKAMDEDCGAVVSNKPYRFTSGGMGVPLNIMGWFLSQGFIGYQMCSVMSQNWLINRACKIPAEDACRNGWRVNGLDAEKIKQLEALDKEWKMKKKVEEYARFKRVFGIRIALFVVQSDDPLYYEKPFNIDGVAPGSYKGISQIDPVWCSPELEGVDIQDPTSCTFYEPTYWRLGTRRVHRSHLVIRVYSEVPDLLKPTYNFGGLPLPQLIWERVYGAERSANEGPQLLLTKRMNVFKTDLETAQADPEKFQDKVRDTAEMRDNFGILAIGEGDEYSQHETGLADVDSVIMTGYQLVASVAEMPSVKLLGTSPKGFNPTGDYEASVYRETLASIQEHDMTPLLDRHYALAQKSLFGSVENFEVTWMPLDEPSEKEQADTNLVRAQEAQIWQSMGVVSQEAVERKLVDDESAGWSQYMKNEETGNDGGSTEEDKALAAAIQSLITGTGVQPAVAQTDPVDGQRGSRGAGPQ